MVIRAPISTRSGYGDMSRDITRHLVNLDKWDIKIVPCRWGDTPMNALSSDDPLDRPIIDRILQQPTLPRQPEVFISITVPNEFEPIGHYNIGVTAGIETNKCSPEWIDGMNKMDLILTISEHSKRVLSKSKYDDKVLTKPIEVLHNCVHTDVFRKIPKEGIEPGIQEIFEQVAENFCFLFVGHWLSGNVGADRKDVGMLVRVFLETFKKVSKGTKRPALILKTSAAGFSVIERDNLIQRIEHVKSIVGGRNLPKVYLLHGDLTEREMNSLYNHPKVKAHITFTKGEGFCRPLLEACMSEKPIIASGWSGHLDFLNPNEAILLSGKLELVDSSAVWPGVINADTKWFRVDYQNAAMALHAVWSNYNQFKGRGVALAKKNVERFNFKQIQKESGELCEQYLPKFTVAEKVHLELPKIKRPGEKKETKFELPKLKKIEAERPTQAEKHGMDAPDGAEGPTKTAQVPQEVGADG
jgi:hypothetical protein